MTNNSFVDFYPIIKPNIMKVDLMKEKPLTES